jgi:hypothetical protein
MPCALVILRVSRRLSVTPLHFMPMKKKETLPRLAPKYHALILRIRPFFVKTSYLQQDYGRLGPGHIAYSSMIKTHSV